MKAVVLRGHGGPDVLEVSEVATPSPGPGEVAVRVRAVGLNYAEILSRKGLYGWAPKLPYVPGMEACGEIDEVGPDGSDRRLGQRVIVGAQYGAYAERIVVPESQALPALEDYTLEENAAFAVNYMTAWVSLMEMARLRPDDRVLITAAAGGVGTAAVQIAKHFGCEVYGAAGSEAKLATLRDLDVDLAVSYGEPDFAEVIRNASDRKGVDVALEVVGGQVFRDCYALLAPFGRIVVAGFAGYELRKYNPLSWWRTWRDMPRASVGSLAVKSRGVLGTHIGHLLKDEALMQRLWTNLRGFVTEHGIRPVVGSTFGFEQMAEAHRFMESRASVGKIVVML